MLNVINCQKNKNYLNLFFNILVYFFLDYSRNSLIERILTQKCFISIYSRMCLNNIRKKISIDVWFPYISVNQNVAHANKMYFMSKKITFSIEWMSSLQLHQHHTESIYMFPYFCFLFFKEQSESEKNMP